MAERGRIPNNGGSAPPTDCPAIARALVAWYARAARDLPWRRTRDPYAIWISEVMLQQTQVATVIPYWTRWLTALPTIQALAAADTDQVLKLWEGLGYYSRARNLRRAAQLILERHGGRFPERPDQVLELPGVGPYTAGAVCSIAFDQPEPILDGNIIRVLTRLRAWPGDPKTKPMRLKLWALARALVRAADAGAHPTPHSALNQALMELGATLCAPRQPECARCPLREPCRARRQGVAETLPTPSPKAKILIRRHVVFLCQRQGRYWVRQRPARGVVNAGLWEFPTVEVTGTKPARPAELAAAWLKQPATTERLGEIRHHITRYRHCFEVCRVEAPAAPPAQAGGWRTPRELEALALAGAHRKIARRFLVDIAP
jgi:A/G-specific adenine glycosylase